MSVINREKSIHGRNPPITIYTDKRNEKHFFFKLCVFTAGRVTIKITFED